MMTYQPKSNSTKFALVWIDKSCVKIDRKLGGAESCNQGYYLNLIVKSTVEVQCYPGIGIVFVWSQYDGGIIEQRQKAMVAGKTKPT